MSDNPNEPVLAYHTVSREKREVPAFWLDSELSPFPGQWKPAPSTLAETGSETEQLPADADVPPAQLPDDNIAGEAVPQRQTEAKTKAATKASGQ